MAIIDELIAILGYDIEGEGKLRRFNDSLDSLNERGRAVAQTMTQWAAIASAAAATATSFLGRSILQTSAEFEGFEVALTTITGSASEARESMDWISDFARRTPYEVAGLTDAFIKLKTYGIDPIANDTLRVLGDTASAMNKPLNDAVEALADATTFQFERLREFGVTASQAGNQVTFSFQKDGETITRTVEKTGTAVRKFLLENFGDRFGNAMEDQSNTFRGILSNLQEGWTDFQRLIGDAGFFDEVKRRMSNLLDTLNRMAADGTLQEWAQRFSDAYIAIMDASQSFIDRMRQHAATIAEMWENPALRAAIIGVGVALGALYVWFAPVYAGLILLGLAIDDFLSYMAGAPSVIGSVIDWFKRLPETIAETDWNAVGEDIVNGIRDGMMAALSTLSDWGDAALDYINTSAEGADFYSIGEKIGGWIFDRLKSNLKRAFSEIAWLAGVIKDAVTGEKSIGDAGEEIADLIYNGLKAAWDLYRGTVMGLLEKVIDWARAVEWAKIGSNMVDGIMDGLRAAGKEISDYLWGLIPDLFKGDIKKPNPDAAAAATVTGPGQAISSGNRGGVDADALRQFLNEPTAAPQSGTQSAPAFAPPAREPIDLGALVIPITSAASRISDAVAAMSKPDVDLDGLYQGLGTFLQNQQAMAQAGEAVTNDNRQDNRDQSVHVQSNITQQITTIEQVTRAAAREVGRSTANASNRAARINSGSAVTP